ncbi:MAG TPA: hypothetical protein VG797_04705 [Phycisphaerales bacterium]|nr:hypothetical protein [Phycisphaerales bacterium]
MRSTTWGISLVVVACCAIGAWSDSARAQTAFVNFESAPVHPIDMSPDGTTLLVANTADDRIEVFDLTTSSLPRWTTSIPVGLSPVSVRARTNTEVWVVNRLSDSVSIVNLTTRNVVKTLIVGDEPADVVFAGSPERAFVTVAMPNQVKVYLTSDLTQAPTVLSILGKKPTALATNGSTVYAAIRESGNRTTLVSRTNVSDPSGPYAGSNPPPNVGSSFEPPLNPLLPPPPAAGMIVRKIGSQWLDDNGGDWSSKVPWNLADHDVAAIDANSLGVSYITGMMNIVMGLAVSPTNGRVITVGTEAMNDIRFEPNVRSQFVRVHAAWFDPATPETVHITDLNPHLDYNSTSIPQEQRDLSIGDPRGIVINPNGNRIYVAGMGSDNVTLLDYDLSRVYQTTVGQGPAGLALDTPRQRVYVFNRFGASVSVLSAVTLASQGTVAFYDPTPAAIRIGRKFMYDTHLTSGLGQVSCASCHVDGDFDQLSWDLGDPSGSMAAAPQGDCAPSQPPAPFNGQPCGDFHPMKGPMNTQTLFGVVNHGPMHWRGDRATLSAFSGAFVSLLGDDTEPTPAEMQQMTDFVQTMTFQPNPNRSLNDSLPTSVPGIPGNPITGQNIMFLATRVGGTVSCVTCHEIQTGGSDFLTVPGSFLGESQTFKTPHLRNTYTKLGFDKTSQQALLGFGFNHDGAVGTIFEFLSNPVFTFPSGPSGDNERNHVNAFLMCFPTGTHAAVGAQLTVDGFNNEDVATINRLNAFIANANSSANPIGLVAHGIVNGERRGYQYIGSSNFQSDRSAQVVTATQLRQGAVPGSEMTFTMVPAGTQRRIGIDRDADGYFDGDERDACSNPNDANIIPGGPGSGLLGDADGDSQVGLSDIAAVVQGWGTTGSPGTSGDLDGDGLRGLSDIAIVIQNWNRTCSAN